MASEMLVNLPRVKRSTVWMFTDTTNAFKALTYNHIFFIFTSAVVLHFIYFHFVSYTVSSFGYTSRRKVQHIFRSHNFTSTTSHLFFDTYAIFAHECRICECELVLIHLCYTGISSFAGDLINSVICLEEASNSTCVTSVAGLYFENTCCA